MLNTKTYRHVLTSITDCLKLSGEDTGLEILFYDHRRWRVAQTIERLGFSLFFGLIYLNF
jgi:hypothetical protein